MSDNIVLNDVDEITCNLESVGKHKNWYCEITYTIPPDPYPTYYEDYFDYVRVKDMDILTHPFWNAPQIIGKNIFTLFRSKNNTIRCEITNELDETNRVLDCKSEITVEDVFPE